MALAAVLGADACEIYTDVDGVSTTDPRIVPDARKIDRISYDEMLELASLGAGVMHSRSIEFAKKYDVPIHVRCVLLRLAGHLDRRRRRCPPPGLERDGRGAGQDEARITVLGVPDCPESLHRLFRRVAESNVSIDMILKNIMRRGGSQGQLHRGGRRAARGTPGGKGPPRERSAPQALSPTARLPKFRSSAWGCETHFGVAATMLEALAKDEVGVQMITTARSRSACWWTARWPPGRFERCITRSVWTPRSRTGRLPSSRATMPGRACARSRPKQDGDW